MIYLILFIFGLCVGSFLNVLIYRETREEAQNGRMCLDHATPGVADRLHIGFIRFIRLPGWVTGRSYCDHCRKKLNWFDNIPLLSFILLKARCRYCHKKIPIQYPIVEFLTGVEFIWIYFLLKSNLNFFSRFEGFYSLLTLISWLGLGASFLAILAADLRYQIIPDSAIIAGIIIILFKLLIDYRFTGMIDFSVFPTALGAGLFFLGLYLITQKKGMGLGDAKLAFLMGLILGFPGILTALAFSFLTGALIGVILIIAGKKRLKSKIAFGPFLIAGLIFSLIYGNKIWVYFN